MSSLARPRTGPASRRRSVPIDRIALLGLGGALAGCWHFDGYRRCDAVPEERLATLPARLSETGLYMGPGSPALAAGVHAYQPRFELWSDGATKSRWMQLPAGDRIDPSDPDDWQFPEGTRFWKEFALAGRPIETRLLQKIGPAPEDWVGAAYIWEADGTDARLAPDGSADAGGTPHDVPSANQCFGCHGGRESRVLGFCGSTSRIMRSISVNAAPHNCWAVNGALPVSSS